MAERKVAELTLVKKEESKVRQRYTEQEIKTILTY
jgi:integrase